MTARPPASPASDEGSSPTSLTLALALVQVLAAVLVAMAHARLIGWSIQGWWLAAAAAGLGLQVAALLRDAGSGGLAFGALLTAAAWGFGPGLADVSAEAGSPYLLLAALSLAAATQLGLLSRRAPSLFYPVLLVLFVPFAARGLASADAGLGYGTAALALAAAFAWLAHGLHRELEGWLALRRQNQALVGDLVRQKEAAEQANVAKSRFLAAASHDLRQPLHALTLFSTALAERIRYPEVRRIVDNITASVAALESLFNSLLDISKLDAGALEPRIVSFRLQELCDRLDNDYRPQAAAKGLGFTTCACEEVVVRSDPALLERMLRNLVANAIRYTSEGSVTVECARRDGGVEITVRDTGVGIAPEHREMIFNEYVQLGNPERDRSKGLGLGLAIVERIARLLDHPLVLESEPGQGSAFRVTVPEGAAAELEAPPDEGAAVAERELEGLSVLVIDDEAAVREAVRVLAQGWGATVLEADSPEAVNALLDDGCEFHCVLADYRLRDGWTGVAALRELERRLGRRLPGVIITGEVGLTRQHPEGIDGYRILHKPVRPARLRAFLRHALSRARAAAHPPN